MAIPILKTWPSFFENFHEGLGSSYERIVLNRLLVSIKEQYNIRSVLEVPVFGFTGVTGINSYELYRRGCKLTLLDHDARRIEKINTLFKDMTAGIEVIYTASYNQLPFSDGEFDFSWNFSALWFVHNLESFLQELTRITSKTILLCVPNQNGLGYRWQKAKAEIPPDITFNESFINPEIIQYNMKKLGWHKTGGTYIDCPPWPDIGMSKEKFLGKYMGKILSGKSDNQPHKVVSIIEYYKGKDPDFAKNMLRYEFLEKHAPIFFKRIWSHHLWMLFEKQ